jgi:hypothetical protein
VVVDMELLSASSVTLSPLSSTHNTQSKDFILTDSILRAVSVKMRARNNYLNYMKTIISV